MSAAETEPQGLCLVAGARGRSKRSAKTRLPACGVGHVVAGAPLPFVSMGEFQTQLHIRELRRPFEQRRVKVRRGVHHLAAFWVLDGAPVAGRLAALERTFGRKLIEQANKCAALEACIRFVANAMGTTDVHVHDCVRTQDQDMYTCAYITGPRGLPCCTSSILARKRAGPETNASAKTRQGSRPRPV